MLVADAATGMPAPIGSLEPEATPPHAAVQAHRQVVPPTLGWLRPLAARQHWVEACTPKGVPCFRLDDGSTIGFEPGGQIEYSSAPRRSASELLRSITAAVDLLHAAADDAGVVLLHLGIDPGNPIDCVPLQLNQPRYVRMDTYLASRGEAGRRMMRQTAATQIAIDLGGGDEILRRWRVLNAAVPYIIAAFANSSRYAGNDTGSSSYRSHVWRSLDATRTGIVGTGSAPIDDYLDFALAAPAMFHPAADGTYQPFGELASSGVITEHDWEDHLSSLFPEIRPRGYFEIRSADAVPPEWLPALVGSIGGIVYDPQATAAALDLLPDPDPEILVAAGRAGLGDLRIARHACDLLTIGLEGCRRLGDDFVEPEHREEMRTIVEQRTARGISPASAMTAGDPGPLASQAAASMPPAPTARR